jgi:hypothetical protein
MGKENGIIILFVILTALLLVFGVNRIKSLQAKIKDQKEAVAKVDQRLESLRNLEESLESGRATAKVLQQIPRVQDPIANKVLIKKFLISFLSRMGFDAEVEVDNERKSKDFPDVIEVNEVPLRIGIRSYSSYHQVMNMLDETRSFPLSIEIFTMGGTDVA